MKQRTFPLTVFNRQRKFRIDEAPLTRFLHQLCEQMEIQAGFSVVLIGERAMRRYNRRFRGEGRPTDVLSFPDCQEDGEEEAYLGDILVCVEVAERQRKKTLLEELKILSLHGLLHLLGYDHETDRGEMEILENSLRKEFQLN